MLFSITDTICLELLLQEHSACLVSKLWTVSSFCANCLLHQWVLLTPLEIRTSCCTPSFARRVFASQCIFSSLQGQTSVCRNSHSFVGFFLLKPFSPSCLLQTFFKQFGCQSLCRCQDPSFGYRSWLRQPFDTWFIQNITHKDSMRQPDRWVLVLPLYQLSAAAGNFYRKCNLRKLGQEIWNFVACDIHRCLFESQPRRRRRDGKRWER